jgi:hypothetical protein
MKGRDTMTFQHIINADVPKDAILALLDAEIIVRSEIAYEFSVNPPSLVDWERYAERSRLTVELFVLESLREVVWNA